MWNVALTARPMRNLSAATPKLKTAISANDLQKGWSQETQTY